MENWKQKIEETNNMLSKIKNRRSYIQIDFYSLILKNQVDILEYINNTEKKFEFIKNNSLEKHGIKL